MKGALARAHVPDHPSGLLKWLSTVDHKQIGLLYLWTSAVFFVIAGLEAMAMRIQLAVPENHFVGPHAYNELFTLHGTTMIFFVAMPAVIGFATYFTPLMIGARDMAYPRMNAFSYFMLLFGGVLLHVSLLVAGGAPSVGWFNYAPLNEMFYTPSHGPTYWALALLVAGVGSVSAGINLIVTVAAYRAPGMTFRRLPLFVWMVLVTSILIILALPALNADAVMLLVDRMLNGNFFKSTAGGSAILWQHVFWVFGHPEVYIVVLPAFGMISEVIPVFARKPLFGAEFVAASTVAIGVLSFGVWVHHMFAVGLGNAVNITFALGSMLIAVPTGVKVFNWSATLFGGSIQFTTSMKYAIAFLIEFTIGGLSGVMFATTPLDWQLTDSYFVVAHLHYTLIGGTVLGLLAGLYYWFPKMSGRKLSERLGSWQFWITIIGFNATFFVQHLLGLMGMPRRVYTYLALPYWGALNMISTIGAGVLGFGFLLLFVNVLWSLKRGEVAGPNPWDAWTLEWATDSPPPETNFERVPPVLGRRPLWELAQREGGGGGGAGGGGGGGGGDR